MIAERTKVSAISWLLVLCSGLTWVTRFRHRQNKHQSNRTCRPNGAGLVRSPAGLRSWSGGKVAVLSTVSTCLKKLR